MQPVFENGINILYMEHFNRLMRKRAVFYAGDDATQPYISTPGSTVHVHHTGLKAISPGDNLAVVPVMCRVNHNQRFLRDHYFLETVNLASYQKELTDLLLELRVVLDAERVLSAKKELSPEDFFWTAVHRHVTGKLFTNSLWYDMIAAAKKQDGNVGDISLTRNIFGTVRAYWTEFLGAGENDSASTQPGLYKTPLITARAVLIDIVGSIVALKDRETDEAEEEDGDGHVTAERLATTDHREEASFGNEYPAARETLAQSAFAHQLLTLVNRFTQTISLQKVGVMQTGKMANVPPGTKMTVMMTY
jgi:hypothetical protein